METPKPLIWHKLFDSQEEAKRELSLNQPLGYIVGMTRVCLIRTSKQIFAIEDACPHKMIKLSKGHLNGQGQIVCCWHAYTFDLKSGAEMTGKTIRNVQTFPLEEREEGIFVGVIEKPPSDDPFSY